MHHLSPIVIHPEPDGAIVIDVGQASWYPGGTAGNSTTCVPDGEKWKSHR